MKFSSLMLVFVGCVSSPTREHEGWPPPPICEVPLDENVATCNSGCWSAPIEGCPGWTWEGCTNSIECMCFGTLCWCRP